MPSMANNISGAGRPQIEGLKDYLVSLDVEDRDWLKEHLKDKVQPDGTKDNLSAWLRRSIRSYREQVEKDELYAKVKAGEQ